MLRRTPLKAKTPLKRGKRLNPMSKRKIAEVNGEYEARVQLCLRCEGNPITTSREIRLNDGSVYPLRTVTCVGGYCEVCKKPAGDNQHLHPHERISRGRGGELTLENSLMCHDYPCHARVQNNILKWSKIDGD